MLEFDYGSPELAVAYDGLSDPQFEHGSALLSLLDVRDDDSVLDLGCGTGRLAAAALERIRARGCIVGVDPAVPRIAVARERADPRLDFHVGRAEDLSGFADASFSVVYLNSVLNWLVDPPRALREVHRVLEAGGRLGIATTVRDRANQLRTLARRAWSAARGSRASRADGSPSGGELAGGVTQADVRSLIAATGFACRHFELRTFTSWFRDVRQIVEFLRATTYGRVAGGASPKDIASAESALGAQLARDCPEALREGGVRLERYVLLAVAEKAA